MATSEQTNALNLYAEIMLELRSRVEWVGHVVAGRVNLDPFLAQEFCLLQLRYIYELLALGCVVAHGDIIETKSRKFSQEWNAGALLNGLETLHPSFFPIPARQEKRRHRINGRRVTGWHFAEAPEPYLKKGDIVRLYGRLGDDLHRGSLARMTNSTARYQGRMETIVEHTNAITRLLSVHHMPLAGGERFVCMLKTQEGTVSVLMAPPAGPPLPIRAKRPPA